MKKFLSLLAVVVSVLFTQVTAHAADAPKDAKKQVQSGLYVTAVEAYDLLQKDKSALLIDVRDPVEMMFTGWTEEADILVPYRIINRSRMEGARFEFPKNPHFASEVEDQLKKLGATKDTKLIFMCRSGSTRSAPAADIFYEMGYKNSYTVVDGFEGGKVKEGPHKGVRAKDGWRNAGLPWTYKLNPEKQYLVLD